MSSQEAMSGRRRRRGEAMKEGRRGTEKRPVVHLPKGRDIISTKLARLDSTLEITYKVKRLAGECSLRPVTKCKWRCIRRRARHGEMARKTRSANYQDIQLDDSLKARLHFVSSKLRLSYPKSTLMAMQSWSSRWASNSLFLRPYYLNQDPISKCRRYSRGTNSTCRAPLSLPRRSTCWHIEISDVRVRRAIFETDRNKNTACRKGLNAFLVLEH